MALLHATTAQAQWEPVAPLPEPNGGFVAGCVEGKILIAGGTNWKDGVKRWLDKVWILDPGTGQWSAAPSLPHSMAYAASGSDGTRLYFAGGADGKEARREVYALDAYGHLARLGELPHPFAFPGGALYESELYAIGGTPDADDWSKATADLRAIHLADGKCSSLAAPGGLPHGIGISATAALGNHVFIFTGTWLDSANQQVHNLAGAFVYDIAVDQWQILPPFPKAARGVSAVALDEHRILLAGGYGTEEEGFLSSTFIFNVKAGSYTPATALPFSATTCLVKCGDWIYILGGEDMKKHRSAQCFRISLKSL